MRVLVCGLGKFGSVYALRANEHAGMEVVGVVESGAMIDEARERGYRAFGSLGEAISITHPQLVIIATPPEQHALLAVYALQRYCNVMLAKPGALSLDEAERVATAAWQRRRALIVDWTPLHSTGWRRVKSLMSSPPMTMRMVRRGQHKTQPCGALWDLAPHDIALALDIAPADKVEAIWARGWWMPEGDELQGAWLMMRHRSGRTTRIEVDWVSAKTERQIEIVGQDAVIVWDQIEDAVGRADASDPEMELVPRGVDAVRMSLFRAHQIIIRHEVDDSERYLNIVRLLHQAESSIYENEEHSWPTF
jgi:predicted dehydrogenase